MQTPGGRGWGWNKISMVNLFTSYYYGVNEAIQQYNYTSQNVITKNYRPIKTCIFCVVISHLIFKLYTTHPILFQFQDSIDREENWR